MFPFIAYLRRQLLRLCKDVDQSSRAAGKVVAVKSDNSGYEHVTLSKSSVGLGNVDNTSDANKPVSTATQTALNGKLALSGGTLTGDVALNAAGSSAAAPRTLSISTGAGQYSRLTVSGQSNGMQSGNGQRTQIYSWFAIDILGDRSALAPAFVVSDGSEGISLRVLSSRSASRPLVVQGAPSQSVNLFELRDSSASVGAYISPGFNQSINGWFRPGSYTVGTLPTTGTPAGSTAYSSNGRKAGEGVGAGTGCPVWYDGTNWKTFYDNTTVAA